MRDKFEHILLSILLGLTVLLGLSFWLNTIFNFNIFCGEHWNELAKLQASHTPISTGFYISFAIAIFIFIVGLYLIYRQKIRRIKIQKTKPAKEPVLTQQTIPTTIKTIEEKKETEIIEPVISITRPPRLNLPRNMAQIAEEQHAMRNETKISPETNPYNSIIKDTFSAAGYVVKPNPKISGFVPNLFAIGNNEIVWVGAVDCDPEKMIAVLQKLDSVFKETLEDIPIHINGFILDTMNKYSENESLLIFRSIDELKEFVKEHPADKIDESDQESFESYSEYIDTIIQYIKNL